MNVRLQAETEKASAPLLLSMFTTTVLPTGGACARLTLTHTDCVDVRTTGQGVMTMS